MFLSLPPDISSAIKWAFVQGKVVWEGSVTEFDTTEEPIVRQFASGSLTGPIKYE